MNTNHQILEAPLASHLTTNIRRKALWQTSLILAFAAALLSAVFGITSCQSPIEINTPRSTKADITWVNDNKGGTTVTSVGDKEPESVLQVQRTVGTTGGTLYVTAFVTSTIKDNSDIANAIKDLTWNDEVGSITIEDKKFPLGVGYINTPTAPTVFKKLIVAGFPFWNLGNYWNAQPTTFGVKNVPLTNGGFISLPQQPKLLAPQENGIVSSSSNITVQWDKPIETSGDVEAELIFSGRDYRIPAVVVPVSAGATSVVLNASDVKDYLTRSGGLQAPLPGYVFPDGRVIPPSGAYILTLRVKRAVAVNDNKIVLSAVSQHSTTVDVK